MPQKRINGAFTISTAANHKQARKTVIIVKIVTATNPNIIPGSGQIHNFGLLPFNYILLSDRTT